MKIIVSNSEMVFKNNNGILGVELCTINSQTPDAPVYELKNNVWGTGSHESWTKQSPINIPSYVTRVYGYISYHVSESLNVPGLVFMDDNDNIIGYSMSDKSGYSLPFDENIPSGATKMIIQAVSLSPYLTVKFGI